MAKKSRSRRKQPEGAIAEAVVSSYLEDVESPGLARVSESAQEPMEPPLLSRLELIRESAQRARGETAETIAQLEEWRAEIDATLAYLRGSK